MTRVRNAQLLMRAAAALLLPFFLTQCSGRANTSGAQGGAGGADSGASGAAPQAGSSGNSVAGPGGTLSNGGASGAAGLSSGGGDADAGAGGGFAGGNDDALSGAGGSAAQGGAAGSQCGVSKTVTTSDTSTLLASGFESGVLSPYTVCTTESPNTVGVASVGAEPAAKMYWQQAGYDGTRLKRGAEACSALNFYKEGWYGFEFYLPSPGFPSDKTLGIAQIFATGGCSSWAAMLQVHGDELWIEHRGDCASPAQFQVQLAPTIPRNTWLPVVLHFVASHASAGLLEIWYGDSVCTPASPTYRKIGINFGFGDWTGDELSQETSNQIGLKFGMYNFDDTNYTPGETRTLYYDNVSQLIGNPTAAFQMVSPVQ